MQRIIQINSAGRVLPIEEDAFFNLKEYINSLKRQFTGEDGSEIIEDIENRIAELFSIRLQSGSLAIDRADVAKVIETLGSANDLKEEGSATFKKDYTQSRTYSFGNEKSRQWQAGRGTQTTRLYRDPYDKVIGGVCSGIAHYFDIDPVIIRLVMVVLFLTAGVGFVAYIIAWIVIPAARTREELQSMHSGETVTFHDISKNVEEELLDLKHRGEQMSRELKDFFSKKR